MSTARQIIEERARKVAKNYRDSLANDCNWAQSITNLTTEVSQEYEDRFLLELIQNAYDAHRSNAKNGCIWIRFAPAEGDHGVLYVANGGNPFSPSNFEKICNLAQSDKVPGAGIGNKGVGFRSVIQVCAFPEIYSGEATQSNEFDGFCFGFATDADFQRLFGDGDEFRQAKRDLSRYLVPVPLNTFPENVRGFAAARMGTVIRLPLHKATSRELVIRELKRLTSHELPILLFLDRIERVIIDTGGADSVVLTRAETMPRIARSETGDIYATVTLAAKLLGGDGDVPPKPLGEYLVVTRRVPPDQLQSAIRESIEKDMLSERFASWRDEAHVSVAVR